MKCPLVPRLVALSLEFTRMQDTRLEDTGWLLRRKPGKGSIRFVPSPQRRKDGKRKLYVTVQGELSL